MKDYHARAQRMNIEGMRVAIYRNLTKNCFSVKAMEGEHYGKVVAHVPLDARFQLLNAEYRVGEKTRDKVRREGKKYVHAVVVGIFRNKPKGSEDFRITYNPYTHDYFQTVVNGETHEVFKTDSAIFNQGQVYGTGSLIGQTKQEVA
jgi:hypothetical protein